MRRTFLLMSAILCAAAAFAANADLAVTLSDVPDPAAVGGSVTYTVIVSNNGPDKASNLVLSDALPSNAEFQSIEGPEEWACTTPPKDSSGSITCSSGSLAAGAQSAFTIIVKPITAGLATSTATVAGAEPDPDTTNNSSKQETTILPADVSPPKIPVRWRCIP